MGPVGTRPPSGYAGRTQVPSRRLGNSNCRQWVFLIVVIHELQRWLVLANLGHLAWGILIILAGAGVFGAVVGSWRSGLQAGHTALKLPLILLLTAAGNAVLNGLLAPLLGLELKLRQSMFAVLLSFVLAAVILASLAPFVAFLIWNLPPMSSGVAAERTSFALLQLTTVAAVAAAGIAGNFRLYQLLRDFAGHAAPATRLLAAWLVTNLLLGTQLSWIARPFFGHPDLAVAFNSNFFEAILYNVRDLLSHWD